jgi:hypothetical protein
MKEEREGVKARIVNHVVQKELGHWNLRQEKVER